MIDDLIYAALTDPTVAELLHDPDGWRVYPAGVLGFDGVPALPQRVYCQYNASSTKTVPTVRDTRQSYRMIYDIFLYDDPGSYQRLRTTHARLARSFQGLAGSTSAAGFTITECLLEGFGADIFDVVTGLCVKRATYHLVVSGQP